MPDKRTILVGRHYATKSRRAVPIKTPGGRLVSKTLKKTSKGPKCSDCKCALPGIKHLTLSAFKNSKKRQRTVSRAYGGAACAGCVKLRIMRAFLVEEQKAVKKLLAEKSSASRPLPSPPVERDAVETLEKKIEKLTKKDEEVARALEEKQKIIADIFNIPPEDYDAITDLVAHTDDRKDAKDVLLAVMSQADNLARCVNDCLKVSDEEAEPGKDLAASGDRGMRLATPPSDKLVTITTNMNTNLTALLVIIQEQEEEKQRWRRELLASQEQVRAFVTGGSSEGHSFRSRPDSFISLESDPADLASEQEDKSDLQEDAIGEEEAAPSSSTPLKEATPTNEVPSDSLENSIENDSLENIVVDETSVDVQHIGEISEVGEIVESSDC